MIDRTKATRMSVLTNPWTGWKQRQQLKRSYEFVDEANKGSLGSQVSLISGSEPSYTYLQSSRNIQSWRTEQPKRAQSHLWRRLWPGNRSGWRFGAALGFWSSLLTLIANIAILGVGVAQRERSGGIGILKQGTPKQTSNISILFHILINFQSTILLSASNYCMQVLTAPTRTEIDIAHRSGHYLDIGVLSLHNLKHIARRRSILFWLLFISSLPLHLFYNSVISTVLSSREADITILTDQNQTEINSMMANGFKHLSNAEWPSSQSIQSIYGNLYLITDLVMCGVTMNTTTGSPDFSTIPIAENVSVNGILSGTFQFNWSQYDQYKSTLPTPTMPGVISFNRTTDNLTSVLRMSTDNWLHLGDLKLHVGSAFTTITDDGSKVQLMIAFMVLVVVCNGAKSAIMGYMTYSKVLQDPLVTGGDAIASFLQHPEARSVGYCVSTQDEILKSWRTETDGVSDSSQSQLIAAQVWHEGKYRVREAVSRRCANVFLFNYLMVVCLVVGALIAAFGSPAQESRWAWGTSSKLSADFGASSVNPGNVVFNTWLTNLPQIFLSAIYFTFNGMLTLMYSAYEWNRWGKRPKHLRVTNPVGDQRSTYFLQLPYKVAIPMTVYSGLLHWLLSQCFFIRRIELYDAQGNFKDGSLNTIGYSPLSLLVFAVLALCGAIMVSLKSLKSLRQRVPFGASSSVVISAACHPPPDDIDTHLKLVQWGVIQRRYTMGGDDDVQHCSFTSELVTRPEVGKKYA